MDFAINAAATPSLLTVSHPHLTRTESRNFNTRYHHMQEPRALDTILEEIFTPELETDIHDAESSGIPLLGNTADVAYQIREIQHLLEDSERFKTQAMEAAAFYQRRIDAVEARALMLKENCGRFLKTNGLKKLTTHSGMIYFSKRTKVTLPSEETLLAFAHAEDPELTHGLITQKPNKQELKKYITSSGHIPDGYVEETVEHISIRKVA